MYYNLYYKRGYPYLCSAKAPVLEGSGSRRVYPLKGTRVDRVYVCLLHVSINKAASYCFSAPLKQRQLLLSIRHCLSVMHGQWRTVYPTRSAKDHTTEVGPISVLSHGGRQLNSLFVKHWRLTHQQRLGKGR